MGGERLIHKNMILSILLPVALASHRPPAWFDPMLAGYKFAYDEKHGSVAVHDSKTGFFLVREIECDGGIVTLTLTRDRKEVSNMGYTVTGNSPPDSGIPKVVEKPLPNLSTGKGLSIGDSEANMKSLYGQPKSVHLDGNAKQFRVCTYKRKTDANYEASYTFKAGKLIEISLLRDNE